MQNRAARIITVEFDYIHVRGIDIVKNLSPSYLSDCVNMSNEKAVRDTRASTSSNLVTVPHAPLALFENYFAYRGPVIWNALPEHVRKCNSLYTFKKALRAHVMT